MKCNEQIASGAFKDGRYWKENKVDFNESVNTTVGIFSLSAIKDNLLMWSHYADSHRGFCIGLDSEILYKLTGSIGPVIYNNEFPERRLNDDENNDFLKLFITKSPDWAYENEYRVLKVNQARTKITLSDDCIKEVILGCKMPVGQKDEIIELVKSRLKHVEIYETELNNNRFNLDIKRIRS